MGRWHLLALFAGADGAAVADDVGSQGLARGLHKAKRQKIRKMGGGGGGEA